MTLVTTLEAAPLLHSSGLTIGTFDGVHMGHQALLHDLKMQLPPRTPLVVFSFSNHPSNFFSPDSPVPLIYPKEEKARLLFALGVDILIMPAFTQSFAQTSFEEFLRLLKKHTGFSHLVLGEGATFGKEREGDALHVKESAKELKFKIEYLPKILLNGHPISSRRIRIAIKSGNFEEAKHCLGRPYGLCGKIFFKNNQAYLYIEENLCLPPKGVFSARLKTPSFTESVHAHIDPIQRQVKIEPIGHNVIVSTEENAQLLF